MDWLIVSVDVEKDRTLPYVMYGEWYGVCDFVVLSVIEVCVDYGGVNVVRVCLDFCVVYGVRVRVNVCDVFYDACRWR